MSLALVSTAQPIDEQVWACEETADAFEFLSSEETIEMLAENPNSGKENAPSRRAFSEVDKVSLVFGACVEWPS
jgi:hypothetical protein